MDLKEIIKEAKDKGFSKEDIKKELLKKGYSNKEIDIAYSNKNKKQKEQKISSLKEIEWQEKIKLLFSEPTTVFEKIREDSITKSLILYAIILFVITAIKLGLLLFMPRMNYFSSFMGMFGVMNSGFLLVFGLIGIFIYSGITHLIINFFKGEGDFKDTFNVIAYSLIPAIILYIIPLVGGFAIIYSIVLMVLGLKKYHKISYGKSIVASLSPIIILIIIIMTFILLMYISLSKMRF